MPSFDIEALKDPDEDVREKAAETFGKLYGGSKVIEALIPLLDDPYSYDPSVRFHGNRSYEEMGDDAPVYPVRQAAWNALKYHLMQDVLAPDVPRLLASKDVDGLIRALKTGRQVIGWIGWRKMDNPELNKVLDSVEREYATYRGEAAKALEQLEAQQAADALLELVEDDHFTTQLHAIRAMGAFRDDRAVDGLMRVLETTKNNDIRQWAMWALGKIGDVRALDLLIRLLHDRDKFTRASAAGALGGIRDDRALEALIKALEDPDDYVRFEAKKALR